MFQRFRILPLLILVAVAMLTLKIGTIWHEIAGLNASMETRAARAAEDPPADGAAQPEPPAPKATGGRRPVRRMVSPPRRLRPRRRKRPTGPSIHAS
jgi:hypothetical protein